MHGGENAREVGGVEEAGRATAEVDCVDSFIAKSRVTPHALLAFDNTRYGLLNAVTVRSGLQARGGVERAPIADFAFDGAGVGGIGRRRSDSGMKITVRALGLAEGHLDVYAQPPLPPFCVSVHYRPLSHSLL
jgi:hypothetical protein